MDKIYLVIHIFDVDGGFGDRVMVDKILFASKDLEVCKKFVDKYSNDHVYDKPFAELWCHKLVVREVAFIEDNKVLDIHPFDTKQTNYTYEDDAPEEFCSEVVYALDDR